jgi:hypothetical protein
MTQKYKHVLKQNIEAVEIKIVEAKMVERNWH